MNRRTFQNMLIVGVEDGSFQKGITHETLLAAVLLRQTNIEKVKIVKITVDGLDATEKLTNALKGWNFDAIMLAGVSFAGFNLIDPTILYEKFKKPVIIISRTKPNNRAVKRALERHFKDWEIRWKVFQKLEPAYKIVTKSNETPLYIEIVGTNTQWATRLIRHLCVCGRVPEPLRIARLIARGLS